MSAREDITRLLAQWSRLTREEAEAIQAEAWATLPEIHQKKTHLQHPLDQALQRWKARATPEDVPHPFRAEIHRLIALESHHAQVLMARRQTIREQQLRLDRARHNLRKVRCSYAPPPSAAWNSYS